VIDRDSLNHSVDYSPARFIVNLMVELSVERLDAVFHALSDPTRRKMLRRLSRGEQNVGELAAPFQMSLAAASKHIKALERAGLIRRVVDGRTHRCRLEPKPLERARAWLDFYERYWTRRLDAFEAMFEGGDERRKR
jgi:DNA-binding transcriptional ArsR family regulator